MGFNKQGEIIRKSGPKRQTQTESQRPYPSKSAYDFFEKLRIIAVGTSGILGWLIMLFWIVFSFYFMESFLGINVERVEGGLAALIAGIFAFYLFMFIISFPVALLVDFLDEQSFGVVFILVALWDTIFFALVFWFLSSVVNPFVAFLLTPLIAYILYIWGKKMVQDS